LYSVNNLLSGNFANIFCLSIASSIAINNKWLTAVVKS
jgi:hypothetical protein